MTMDTQTDWRYSDEKMKLRQQDSLLILLNKFGEELNSSNTSKEPNQDPFTNNVMIGCHKVTRIVMGS